MPMVVTTLTYGQFLVNGVKNFTGTYFAEIAEGFSHDSVWRYLNKTKLPARVIWDKVKEDSVLSEHGCLLFDDSVLDKSFSEKIALARWQYSGTTHETVMGIGVVNCLYYNPELDRSWIIDARMYQPDQDGKKKYEHLKEMLLRAIERGVVFRTVLMDTWYAITHVMMFIDRMGKKFVCPIRSNRSVLDHWTDPEKPKYRAVKDLPWEDEAELARGKDAKLKECSLTLKLFRLTVHPNRTDYVVTNDHEQVPSSDDATKACAARWKIEQYHRETKQTTGIAKCQARNTRAQRTPIMGAILSHIVLSIHARLQNQTIYELKDAPLKAFQAGLWRKPYTVFTS